MPTKCLGMRLDVHFHFVIIVSTLNFILMWHFTRYFLPIQLLHNTRIFCTFTRLYSTNMLSRYTINCMRGVGLADLNPRKQLPADEYWYYRKLCCLHRWLNFTHAFWQHCVDGFELRGAPRHCTLHSYSSTLRAITYSCGASSPDIFQTWPLTGLNTPG